MEYKIYLFLRIKVVDEVLLTIFRRASTIRITFKRRLIITRSSY